MVDWKLLWREICLILTGSTRENKSEEKCSDYLIYLQPAWGLILRLPFGLIVVFLNSGFNQVLIHSRHIMQCHRQQFPAASESRNLNDRTVGMLYNKNKNLDGFSFKRSRESQITIFFVLLNSAAHHFQAGKLQTIITYANKEKIDPNLATRESQDESCSVVLFIISDMFDCRTTIWISKTPKVNLTIKEEEEEEMIDFHIYLSRIKVSD